MCCKLLGIEELGKARGEWCVHCTIGTGCNIYETRPEECRNFYCGYLINRHLDEQWKPSKSRMVLAFEDEGNHIVIYVDPSRVDVWRKEPWYAQIKRWAIAASRNQGQVIIWQGQDAIVVLPNREKNLGPVRDDQLIVTSEIIRFGKTDWDVRVMDRDDPAIQKLQKY
jgi:hypothetical protein